jgi:hypothetical protein
MASSTKPKKREKLWSNIMESDVAPKVRMLASNALASNTNNMAIHILEDDTCTICEDVAHAVARCPRAS